MLAGKLESLEILEANMIYKEKDQGSHRLGTKVTWVKVKGHMGQGQPWSVT